MSRLLCYPTAKREATSTVRYAHRAESRAMSPYIAQCNNATIDPDVRATYVSWNTMVKQLGRMRLLMDSDPTRAMDALNYAIGLFDAYDAPCDKKSWAYLRRRIHNFRAAWKDHRS